MLEKLFGYVCIAFSVSLIGTFIFTSCVTSDKYSSAADRVGSNGLIKYQDQDAICYVYKDSDKWGSLSCIKKEGK